MRRVMVGAALAATLLGPLTAQARPEAFPGADTATTLLEQMSPEERVGQLFLVTFRGSAPGPDEPIFDLIRNGHISGVILEAGNDNFVDAPGTLDAARALIASLQAAALQAPSGAAAATATPGAPRPVYTPLFVGLSQEGNGPPFSQILSGLSEIPSEMAIGATWDPALARDVGERVGQELGDLGVNLLLGPALDVLGDPRLSGPGDLGVRAFGGDPFWVGLMGQAYIDGVHVGSGGRVGVVAEHFPGLGGSDRPPDEEVATVRRSLDELTQEELAPFFAVTGGAPGKLASVTDGLLTAHIRYQGFQGNIRATTRPISLDRDAFGQLMALGSLATWRDGGGVMVSDSLGSRAIRRWVDPLERTFAGQLVARDAFLAGNDLLMLSNFKSSEDPDEVVTIKATLAFFAQKYREDPLFAQRVDASVVRVLRLKLRLYGGSFAAPGGLGTPQPPALATLDRDLAFKVARSAATLISPLAQDLEDRLGGPPRLGQRIVFFTDVRLAAQCTNCASHPEMDVRALERRVLDLYGSRAAGQIRSWNLASFTLADLAVYLGEPAPAAPVVAISPPDDVDRAIKPADWLVFSILSERDGVYGSNALKLLLDRRPDLARDKRVVVFAYDVPYDLDATDISKIDAYFALYGKTPAFVDVAARLLFGEIPAEGAAPVSIPGIGYDLMRALSPAPNQVISLSVRGQGGGAASATPVGYKLRDVIAIETGVILDSNGHPVPDGTPVDFILSYQGELPSTLKSATGNGKARANLTLNRLGLLTVSARSDPATTSDIIQLNVPQDVPAFVTVIAPTPVPSATVSSPKATSTPTSAAGAPGSTEGRGVGAAALMLGLLGVLAMAGAGWAAADRQQNPEADRARFILPVLIGGLAGYNYLALGLPGSGSLLEGLGPLAGLVLALAGGAVGLAFAELWFLRGGETG